MTYPAASGSSDLQKWLWGRDFMRFTLTYDGPLPSKGGPSEKAAIREHFHPQLAKLWRINPTLKTVMRARYWPTGGAWLVGSHHSEDLPPMPDAPPNSPHLDLCEPIQIRGAKFLPLVRETLALKCELKILILRQVPPGGILDNGDLDNRLKTLFDALSIPDRSQEKQYPSPCCDGPIYTLLQNDRDVLGLEIDTRQLLTAEAEKDDFVRLVIDVTTRVVDVGPYNQSFLGD